MTRQPDRSRYDVARDKTTRRYVGPLSARPVADKKSPAVRKAERGEPA